MLLTESLALGSNILGAIVNFSDSLTFSVCYFSFFSKVQSLLKPTPVSCLPLLSSFLLPLSSPHPYLTSISYLPLSPLHCSHLNVPCNSVCLPAGKAHREATFSDSSAMKGGSRLWVKAPSISVYCEVVARE